MKEPALKTVVLAQSIFAFGMVLLPAIGYAGGAETASAKDNVSKEQSEDLWQRKTLTGEWGGLRKKLEDAGVTFAVNEQSELWANLKGGIRTGATHNGLTTPSLKLDLEKLVEWKGATFFVNAYQIHGVGPTRTLVGDQQTLSNIEALPSIKLFQLWVEQSLFKDRVNIRVGQQGADEMMASQSAQLFINSSFGYPDLPEQDLPSGGPNYPLATPMVRTKVKIDDHLTCVNAIFNGDPAGPGPGEPERRNPSGTAFRLNDPPLIFNEFWYNVGEAKPSAPLPGTYKIGAWVHTGSFQDQSRNPFGSPLPFSNLVAARYRGDFAVYGIADQMIWRKPGSKDEGFSLFGLIMKAPDDRNRESLFAEAGLNWKGIVASRPDDVFGLGVAYAQTSSALLRFGEESIALTGSGKHFASHETVIEATYLYQIAPWWTVQPDLQYVINPGASLPPEEPGVSAPRKNALVIGVRTKVDF
jgi:porin